MKGEYGVRAIALAALFLLGLAASASAQCGAGQMVWETATATCPAACTDGLDNDGDGLSDASAPGCKLELAGRQPAGPFANTTFNYCSDGFDNDNDGFVDRTAAGTSVSGPNGSFASLGPDENCRIETNWGAYNACTDSVNNDNDFSDNTAGGTTPSALIDKVAPGGAIPDPECLGEVLCQDGVDNDTDGATDASDADCMCLNQASGFSGSTVCTANDFTIAFTANPQEIADGCINSSDQVTLSSLRAALTSHVPQRYDLGLWIVLDGTSAQNGNRCLRQMLTPVKYAGVFPDPVYPPGPYQTLEPISPQDQTDQCGDVGAQRTAVWEYPMLVTVPCTDQLTLANGFVDLGQCGSWDNNDNTICSSVEQALPNTKSKCQCQEANTNVPAPNLRTSCSSFATPTITGGNGGPSLDPGETASFHLSFTNSVTNCTSGTPAGLPTDPFGRARCGTVSFMRFEIVYDRLGVDADAQGDFYLDDGVTPIPTCPSVATISQSPLPGSGVLCNDTAGKRLIWAPRDPIGTSGSNYPAYGVVSAFSGTMTLPFKYKLLLAPSDPDGVSMEALILWDNDLDTNNDDVISAAEAVTVGQFARVQNSCLDCGCSSAFSTTPVTLASFSAEREGSRVVFGWTTATEVGNVGFNILGKSGADWVRLNPEPLPAEGGDGLAPREYRGVLSVPQDITEFAIEDINVSGHPTRHALRDGAAAPSSLPAVEPIDHQEIRREGEALAAERDVVRRRMASESPRAVAAPAVRVGAAAPPLATVIDLKVSRDGLYRVTYEDLKAAGFDLAGVQVAKLGLSSRGADVPIYVSPGRTVGPGFYFEFYGRALDTLYTTENVYRLILNAKKPARAEVSAAAPGSSGPPSYRETRAFERNRDYSFLSPTGDPWYDSRMFTYTSPAQWSFPFTVDALAGGPARLAVRMFGGTDPPVDPDHHVVLSVNGVEVGSFVFNGLADFPVAVDLPPGTLVEGANTLVVRLPADLGAPFDIVYLDSFSVSYPRRFAAESGALTFTASGGRFDVAGLSGPSVVAYRVGGSSLTRLAGATMTASGGGLVATLPGDATEATYAVAAESALLKPVITAARVNADILSGPAQYLVISHPNFIAGLAPLVAARQAQGLTVRVVDVEDVYGQLGYGIFDPAAIRAYIAQAAAAMGTEYVLLVGGDTYDYHDYLGLHSTSLIPSLYGATDAIVRFAPVDPAYADLDGDGAPDLAIGRLPVRTRAELDTLVAKILAYQNKDYSGTAVFAADDRDPLSNVPFKAVSEKFVSRLAGGWQVMRSYLDDMPVADARAVLVSGINAGTALTNYVGHSGPTMWSNANLFNVNDAGALTNFGRPTVVAQWGCWNTYYVNPRMETLGTKLLLGGDRGAAAVLGATTLTQDTHENALGNALASLIAQPGMTIGKAVQAAKQSLPGAKSEIADVLMGWILLGDPALVVQP